MNVQIKGLQSVNTLGNAIILDLADVLRGIKANTTYTEKELKRRCELAVLPLTIRIFEDTDPYVPYKTGFLSENLQWKIEGARVEVEYVASYAPYAFNPIAPSGKEKNYTKTVHPEARGEPLAYSFSVNEDKWAEYFVEEVFK